MNKDEILACARQVFHDERDGITEVMQRLEDGESFLQAIELISKCQGKVCVMGIGKSGHIARKIAATFASTGTPAFFVHPAEASHGDLGMIESNDIVIAISYSGEADEILAILQALRRKHIKMIGITGKPGSNLAKASDLVLNIAIDKEACPLGLAPTTSTTAALVLGDAMAVTLLKLHGFKKEDFALSHPGGVLGKRLLTMVADIMHSGNDLPRVYENDKLRDVVIEISKKRLGMAGVVDANHKLVGIITDGDLRRLLDRDGAILDVPARSIMTKNPKILQKDSLAVTAIDMIEEHSITGFLVADKNMHLVGAFNLHDLFKAKLL